MSHSLWPGLVVTGITAGCNPVAMTREAWRTMKVRSGTFPDAERARLAARNRARYIQSSEPVHLHSDSRDACRHPAATPATFNRTRRAASFGPQVKHGFGPSRRTVSISLLFCVNEAQRIARRPRPFELGRVELKAASVAMTAELSAKERLRCFLLHQRRFLHLEQLVLLRRLHLGRVHARVGDRRVPRGRYSIGAPGRERRGRRHERWWR